MSESCAAQCAKRVGWPYIPLHFAAAADAHPSSQGLQTNGTNVCRMESRPQTNGCRRRTEKSRQIVPMDNSWKETNIFIFDCPSNVLCQDLIHPRSVGLATSGQIRQDHSGASRRLLRAGKSATATALNDRSNACWPAQPSGKGEHV
jgi:hypothetical protein